MRDLSRTFGLIIAFLIPGFVGLWAGAGVVDDPLGRWFELAETADSQAGVILFLVAAAIGTGVLISASRWIVLEVILFGLLGFLFKKRLGDLTRPRLDYSGLDAEPKTRALEALVENFYRYHLFYGNMLIAVALAFGRWSKDSGIGWWDDPTKIFYVVELVLLFGAGSSLRRYHRGAVQLLGEEDDQRDERTGP